MLSKHLNFSRLICEFLERDTAVAVIRARVHRNTHLRHKRPSNDAEPAVDTAKILNSCVSSMEQIVI